MKITKQIIAHIEKINYIAPDKLYYEEFAGMQQNIHWIVRHDYLNNNTKFASNAAMELIDKEYISWDEMMRLIEKDYKKT